MRTCPDAHRHGRLYFIQDPLSSAGSLAHPWYPDLQFVIVLATTLSNFSPHLIPCSDRSFPGLIPRIPRPPSRPPPQHPAHLLLRQADSALPVSPTATIAPCCSGACARPTRNENRLLEAFPSSAAREVLNRSQTVKSGWTLSTLTAHPEGNRLSQSLAPN